MNINQTGRDNSFQFQNVDGARSEHQTGERAGTEEPTVLEKVEKLVRNRVVELQKKEEDEALQEIMNETESTKAKETNAEANAAKQKADEKTQRQALDQIVPSQQCQVDVNDAETKLENQLTQLQHCLSKGGYLSSGMSRELGVKDVHVSVFGDHREGKSQFINNVLCALLKMYRVHTDFRASATKVTNKVTLYHPETCADLNARTFPFCLMDMFGLEWNGSNWYKLLAPVLKGDLRQVEDTTSKTDILDVVLNTEKFIGAMSEDSTRPDYTKMTYGLMLMVNGQRVANMLNMRSPYLERLKQFAEVLSHVGVPYDPVVLVSYMDKVEGCVMGNSGFTLTDAAKDKTWKQVQQLVAEATGVLPESIFPVLPVRSDDDIARMVMSLNPLVHLLENKIERTMLWALDDKARYERENQSLDLAFIDHAIDPEDLHELVVEPDRDLESSVKHRSVASVKRQIAEMLGVNLNTITRLEYQKSGDEAWVLLDDDDNLDALGINGEDTLRVIRSE